MKTRFLSFILVCMLIATACGLAGCAPDVDIYGAEVVKTAEIGEGGMSITFTVVTGEKTSRVYKIKTDRPTLGAALLDCGLIEAPQSGFVTVVDGIEASWARDASWWALYEEGEMAMVGVEDLNVADGGRYAFVYTVG